jgi:hypothetical protein
MSIRIEKEGNKEMRRKLDDHLDRIESAETTCRVELHYKKGVFVKAGMALPNVLGNDD